MRHRRHGGGCTQRIVTAEPLEQQLVDWLRDFRPDAELRTLVLDAIQVAAGNQDDDQARRRDLHGPPDRLKDLYVIGDLSKDQYVIRRQALEQEVERLGPPVDPDIARAEGLLDARFWEIEEKPAERNKLLGQLFDRTGRTAARSLP